MRKTKLPSVAAIYFVLEGIGIVVLAAAVASGKF